MICRMNSETLMECKQTKSFKYTIITTRTAKQTAQMHLNMLYMPHCKTKDFVGRWQDGMTPWNQKYFVPKDIKPAGKTGMSYIMLPIFFCLMFYTNLWLLCYMALPVINTLLS